VRKYFDETHTVESVHFSGYALHKPRLCAAHPGGGTLKITACIETPEVIAQIPDYLQRRSAPEGPCARGPPPQRGDEEERLGSAVADFIVDNFLTRVHRRDGEGDKERSDN
jgi:hypothetical protein